MPNACAEQTNKTHPQTVHLNSLESTEKEASGEGRGAAWYQGCLISH